MATQASSSKGSPGHSEGRHPFGELLDQYRARKPGLTQTRLAHLAGYDQAILVRMGQGKKDLTGPSGRERVVRIIETLADQGALRTGDEANALLLSATQPPLFEHYPAEAKLIARLERIPAGHRVRRTNLPAPLAGLIGRTQEIAEVKRLLKSSRLLTLTGSGGAGKTRLAQQTAADVLITYTDGVWYAELASLQDGALIADAVARAMGLAQADRPALEQVCDFLRERHVLLVLDNCEHLIDAVAAFAIAVLQACPRATILATGREALNVEGETAWRVPPMLPDEAAQLFVTRAQAARGSAALSEQNETVTHICRRLDGMPLAIELAAARLNSLSLNDIAARLDDRFNLLAHGRRGALPRHQTLRAMIDWSYELLSEPEKAAFRRLGVFVGGWAIDEAEKVAGLDAFQSAHTQLIGKSLIVVEDANGTARYRCLETIREYALEKLAEASEMETTRRRHADAFMRLAEASTAWLHGAQQRAWLARLERESPNLQAAMDWCLMSGGDALMGCRIAGALFHYWYIVSSRFKDAQKWTRAARAAVTETMPPAVQAWVLLNEEWFCGGVDTAEERSRRIHDCFVQAGDAIHAAMAKSIIGRAVYYANGDYPLNLRLSEEGVEEARALGADWELRFNLEMLAECLRFAQQEPARAEATYREAMMLSKAAGDLNGYARTLGRYVSGFALERLEFEESLHCTEEALEIVEHTNDLQMVLMMQNRIAENLYYLGRETEAMERLASCQSIAQEFMLIYPITTGKVIQARIAISQANYQQARALLNESLSIARAAARPGAFLWGAHVIVDGMSALAAVAGQSERAACLRGVADRMFAKNGQYRSANIVWEYAPYMAKAREALGDEAFDAACAAGRAMSMDESIARALGDA